MDAAFQHSNDFKSGSEDEGLRPDSESEKEGFGSGGHTSERPVIPAGQVNGTHLLGPILVPHPPPDTDLGGEDVRGHSAGTPTHIVANPVHNDTSSDEEVIPDVVYNNTKFYPGNPGLRLNYSGLKECGEHVQKTMKNASVTVTNMTNQAVATLNNTHKLWLHQRGLHDSLRDYKKAERFFKENLRDKHKGRVKRARRLLSRGIPLGVVEEAHQMTELNKLADDARRRAEAGIGAHMVNGELLNPHSHNKSWAELDALQKEEWGLLGWSAGTWDRDTIFVPDSATKPWVKLTGPERDAATRLGFTIATWKPIDPIHPGYGPNLGLVRPEGVNPANLEQDSDIINDGNLSAGNVIKPPEPEVQPNAKITSNEGVVQVHAVEDIPAGEPIKMGYSNGKVAPMQFAGHGQSGNAPEVDVEQPARSTTQSEGLQEESDEDMDSSHASQVVANTATEPEKVLPEEQHPDRLAGGSGGSVLPDDDDVVDGGVDSDDEQGGWMPARDQGAAPLPPQDGGAADTGGDGVDSDDQEEWFEEQGDGGAKS